MREVAQREGRVRGRELLADDARRDGVHAAPAAGLVGGDAQQAQLAAAREERAVELLLFVVLGALRVHLLLRELAHHLAQGPVLFRRVVHVRRRAFRVQGGCAREQAPDRGSEAPEAQC